MSERPVVIAGGHVVDPSQGLNGRADILVENGRIKAVHAGGGRTGTPEGASIVDAKGLHVFPGFVDARVHVGEPGGEHRETNLAPALRDKHKAKTADDVAEKARVARKAKANLGLKPAPAKPIQSPGFAPKPAKPSTARQPEKLAALPRRAMFR